MSALPPELAQLFTPPRANRAPDNVDSPEARQAWNGPWNRALRKGMVCPTCGALVDLDAKDAHKDWHRQLWSLLLEASRPKRRRWWR